MFSNVRARKKVPYRAHYSKEVFNVLSRRSAFFVKKYNELLKFNIQSEVEREGLVGLVKISLFNNTKLCR